MKVVKKVFFIALMIFILCHAKTYAATGTIKTEGARIRQEANVSSEIITVAYEGETVEITEKSGDWYKVKYNDSIGYIRGDLMEVSGDVTENTTGNAETVTKEENKESETTEKTSENETKESESKEDKTSFTVGEKSIKSNTAIRITPCLFSSVIGEAIAGNKINVEGILNNWGKVKLDNGKTGWILLNMLEEVKEAEVLEEEPSTKTGYINVSAAVIRSGPSTSSDPIAEISRNKTVEIMSEENDWYKILYNGQEAYIAKRLVSDNRVEESSRSGQQERAEEPAPNESVAEETISTENTVEEKEQAETKAEAVPPEKNNVETSAPAVATSRGEEVVAYAKRYLGYSYVYGGAGPSSFDCSGFTQYVYKQFGISLAHSAVTQANNGTYVSKENLMPGDLVIFRDWDNVSIGHCGIYIGGGQFIHAANSKRGVVTDTLNSGYYYERYVTGRRLL